VTSNRGVRQVAEFRANSGYGISERKDDFELIPLALIFLVVLVVGGLVVHLNPAEEATFLVANILIGVAFAVDYFARLYLSPVRRRFVTTHILDLSHTNSIFIISTVLGHDVLVERPTASPPNFIGRLRRQADGSSVGMTEDSLVRCRCSRPERGNSMGRRSKRTTHAP
jgi:hypothetical protein